MEEEGKGLEKCMKRIAGRTIEKVYGSAAIRCIPAELRQAIKERREGLQNDRRTQEDLGGYKREKMRVNRMKLQEQKRKELKLIIAMKIGKWREVKWFWRINGKWRQGTKGLEEEGRDIVDRYEQASLIEEYRNLARFYTNFYTQIGGASYTQS